MKYTNIIFDLDGTITEPALGITNSIIYALDKFNIKVEDRCSLYKFIGPPLIDSFMEYYGFDADRAKMAVSFYREYYSTGGIRENEIMPGMEQALRELKSNGLMLYVATSKPQIYAEQILEILGIRNLFEKVAGSLLDGSRDKKEMVLGYLLEGLVKEPGDLEQCIMIGDRSFDIEGAKLCGIANMGISFGYGSVDELKNAGAMYIAQSPKEITDFLCGTNQRRQGDRSGI